MQASTNLTFLFYYSMVNYGEKQGGAELGGELKNRKRFSASISLINYDVFKELSQITRIPQSRLLDEALNDLFAKYSDVLTDEYTRSIKEEIEHYRKTSKTLEERRR